MCWVLTKLDIHCTSAVKRHYARKYTIHRSNVTCFQSFATKIVSSRLPGRWLSVSQKVPTFKLSVTLSNLNRFSKFMQCWKACGICYRSGGYNVVRFCSEFPTLSSSAKKIRKSVKIWQQSYREIKGGNLLRHSVLVSNLLISLTFAYRWISTCLKICEYVSNYHYPTCTG